MKTTIAIMALALASCCTPMLAAGEDASEILRRFVEADAKNHEKSGQYTYVEHVDHFTYSKSGEPKKERSETNEIMFVEGEEYKKLIARNDKPLDAREQAKEDKRLAQTAEERRKQRKSGMFHKSFTVGSNTELLTLFDCQFAGEQELKGRKAWVVDCNPKPDRVPASQHEKDALSFRERIWIDQSEYVALRKLHTVVAEHFILEPGGTFQWDFGKVNEDAWVTTEMVIDGRLQLAKIIKPRVRTEQKTSKFQKFDVRSTITIQASE